MGIAEGLGENNLVTLNRLARGASDGMEIGWLPCPCHPIGSLWEVARQRSPFFAHTPPLAHPSWGNPSLHAAHYSSLQEDSLNPHDGASFLPLIEGKSQEMIKGSLGRRKGVFGLRGFLNRNDHCGQDICLATQRSFWVMGFSRLVSLRSRKDSWRSLSFRTPRVFRQAFRRVFQALLPFPRSFRPVP